MTHSFPPGLCIDENLNRDTAAETGCGPELTSDPNLGCTGEEWGVGRHRGHRVGGFVRPSGTWRVEFEVHGGKGLDDM